MTPRLLSSSAAGERPVSPAIASSRCSVLTKSSLSARPRPAAFVGDRAEPWRETELRAAVGLGILASACCTSVRDDGRIELHLAEHVGDDAALLLDERDEQVLGLELRVLSARSAICWAARIASWAFSV